MAVVDESRSSRFAALLKPYLPAPAVEPIVRYIVGYDIFLTITRERHSKFGDYRLPTTLKPGHRISVNGNLQPEGFLLVMLHELAHLLTFVAYRRGVKPHGLEWQRNYSRLIVEFVNKDCFAPDVSEMLRRYASSQPLDKTLERQIDIKLKVLPSAAIDSANLVTLDTLPQGSHFRIKGNATHTFESLQRLRTRWKCRDLATGRLYSVSGSAPVEVVDRHYPTDVSILRSI